MYDESDYIMLSALQHYMFCPRQCALIHIEQQWSENRYTAEGQVLHERADSNKSDTAGNIRIVRTLPLCSHRLGLTGQADVVEFHQDGTIFPVEYKRGKPKANRCDEVQLCAQALCLEEMLNTKIADGALFYGKRRRRTLIVFDATLRKLTEQVIDQVHNLLSAGVTPPASYGPQCDSCSLLNICLPQSCAKGRSVKLYMERMLKGQQ
jgi:CRISPR-associated exonuclease Cas4